MAKKLDKVSYGKCNYHLCKNKRHVKVYTCKYCGYNHCEKHKKPKLPSMAFTSRSVPLGDITTERWVLKELQRRRIEDSRKEDAHPCFSYVNIVIKEIQDGEIKPVDSKPPQLPEPLEDEDESIPPEPPIPPKLEPTKPVPLIKISPLKLIKKWIKHNVKNLILIFIIIILFMVIFTPFNYNMNKLFNKEYNLKISEIMVNPDKYVEAKINTTGITDGCNSVLVEGSAMACLIEGDYKVALTGSYFMNKQLNVIGYLKKTDMGYYIEVIKSNELSN